ncbi:MAG TPA: flagellar basal body rod C-terminal domain-containing protein [Candidatus Dormibacteraeota bacterium]|nr:flagellar basal body rod C-terminal domain-containing protein [Candidatus Dormibacteraeota bacterium]
MDGIAWAQSAMVAARTRLDIATGNLANVSTNGFARLVARGSLTARGVVIRSRAQLGHGGLRPTGRAYDLAIVGDGNFRVRELSGRIVRTRNGAFERDVRGHLHDDAGRVLLGTNGALRVPDGATFDAVGRLMLHGTPIGRVPLPRGSSLRAGFIETANVNAIGEMVDVLAAERSYESAEKVMSAIDGTRQKAANDVARLK